MAPSHLKGPSEDYQGTSWVIRCDEKKVQRHRSRPASTTPTLSSAIAHYWKKKAYMHRLVWALGTGF